MDYDYELEKHYHPENFEMANDDEKCPEGHICTSDCQNTRDCPCNDHEHSMSLEEKVFFYNQEVNNAILEAVKL